MKNHASLLVLLITLLVSACGVEGVPTDQESAAQLGAELAAANPSSETTPGNGNVNGNGNDIGTDADSGASTSDSADEPTGQNSADGPQTSVDANAQPATEAAKPVVNQPSTSSDTENLPVIDFSGTTFFPEQRPGELIVLDGSNSTVQGSNLVSFKWEQINDSGPKINLVNANSASTYFVAQTELSRVRLKFKLTVTAATGKTASSIFEYRWTIEEPPEVVLVIPTIINTEQVADLGANGSYTLGKTGGYYAESIYSVYMADQTQNQIVHFNAATGTELNTFKLTSRPTQMIYVDSARSIYVALDATSKMVKINIDTAEQVDINLAGELQSMAYYNDRVYYTVDASFYDSNLHSFGATYESTLHGKIDGQIIEINSVTGELVAAREGSSPATVYRYTIAPALIELQSSRDLGSSARDIAISPDGERLAYVTGTGNGTGYTIHDIMASDLTVSNGAWDTLGSPSSADFNSNGTLFTASNDENLFLFDANSHVQIENYAISQRTCGLNYYDVTDASFSGDDKHIFAKMVCGYDDEKTVLHFYRVN